MKFLYSLFFVFTLSASNIDEAVKLYNENKFDEAKVIFEKILIKEPNNYKAIEYLGDIGFHQKKWLSCNGYFKILKDKFPKNADYHFKYGGSLAFYCQEISKVKALKYINEIENSFLKSASLAPKHINVRWALVMFYCELPAILGGTEKKAKKYAEELLQISKVDGYMAQGHIEEYHKRYKEAESYYKKAHEIGQSKVTLQKLVDLYEKKLKDKSKAQKIKDDFKK